MRLRLGEIVCWQDPAKLLLQNPLGRAVPSWQAVLEGAVPQACFGLSFLGCDVEIWERSLAVVRHACVSEVP